MRYSEEEWGRDKEEMASRVRAAALGAEHQRERCRALEAQVLRMENDERFKDMLRRLQECIVEGEKKDQRIRQLEQELEQETSKHLQTHRLLAAVTRHNCKLQKLVVQREQQLVDRMEEARELEQTNLKLQVKREMVQMAREDEARARASESRGREGRRGKASRGDCRVRQAFFEEVRSLIGEYRSKLS